MLPGLCTPLFLNSSGPNIASLFATNIWSGAGGTRTLTNGIDLATGGLCWVKYRSDSAGLNAREQSHHFFDSERAAFDYALFSNTTEAQNTSAYNNTPLSDGITLANTFNQSGTTWVAWSFARAARFFDVVTWTGNGGSGLRSLSHSLGVTPGMIICKSTSQVDNWTSYHRSLTSSALQRTINLNTTAAQANQGVDVWAVSDTAFSISSAMSLNDNGQTYVAYLFAHDTAAGGVVQCGSYTGNGSSTGPAISLDWQPQWLLVKRADNTGDWWIYDSARSTSNPRILKLLANSSAAEDTTGEDIDFTSTGFQPKTTAAGINANTGTYVYVAIRSAS